MNMVNISFSDARAGQTTVGNSSWYIIDTIECGLGADVGALSRDIHVLTSKLSRADLLAFGLFNCKGVRESNNAISYPRTILHDSSHRFVRPSI